MSIVEWLLGRRFTVQALGGSHCFMSSAIPRLSYTIQGMSGSHAVFHKNKNKKKILVIKMPPLESVICSKLFVRLIYHLSDIWR